MATPYMHRAEIRWLTFSVAILKLKAVAVVVVAIATSPQIVKSLLFEEVFKTPPPPQKTFKKLEPSRP